MYFRISSKSVKLVELEDVTSFHAVCPAGLRQRELAEIVGNEDLGEVLPAGSSLWTRYGGWRPAGSGPHWEQDLDRMIAYADRKGWLSDDGTRVRAHLEMEQV